MSSALIAVIDGLTVVPALGGAPVVDGVSLTVRRGEVLGLVGASGSGKTTASLALLGRIRQGLHRAAGSVRVVDRDPFAEPQAVRGRLAGYLGQDPAQTLNPARRIGSLLDEMIRLRGRSGDEIAAERERLLAAVHLPGDRPFLRRFPHEISGGQAQRLALAIAMAGEPPLLLLDEPTSGLDLLIQRQVRLLVRHSLRERSAAACGGLVISHDLALVGELADRVVAIANGRVVAEGEPERVLRPIRAGARQLPTGPVAPAGAAPLAGATTARLVARDLSAWHGSDRAAARAVDSVSFTVLPGECLAIVGPSGSGKSTIARCVVGLHGKVSGELELDGASIGLVTRGRNRIDRQRIQLVAQDPLDALNPRESVGEALARPLRSIRGMNRAGLEAEIGRLLHLVRLRPEMATRRPSQLSGGERQRVNLARALAAEPSLLVCDEVTSALDIETQGAILALLDDLRQELGVSLLFVTHDAASVRRLAHRVLVFDHGRVVEEGTVQRLFAAPSHPLTQALVAATLPMFAPNPADPLAQIAGRSTVPP